jgi:hypothetical protein
MRKQKLRQHAKHKAKYDAQTRKTEAHKLEKAEKRLKRIARAKVTDRVAPIRNESQTQREERHKLHQAMTVEHKIRKVMAKEAHNKRLHSIKIIPIHLV